MTGKNDPGQLVNFFSIVILMLILMGSLDRTFAEEEEPVGGLEGEQKAGTPAPEDILKINALGRAARLGALFNAKTETFSPVSILNKPLKHCQTKKIDAPKTSTRYGVLTLQQDKSVFLGISPTVAAGLRLGTIQTAHSAAVDFLLDTKINENSVVGAFVYETLTAEEHLELFFDEMKSVVSKDLLNKATETHVCIGIGYGSHAILKFEDSRVNRTNIDEAQRQMEERLQKLAFGGAGWATPGPLHPSQTPPPVESPFAASGIAVDASPPLEYRILEEPDNGNVSLLPIPQDKEPETKPKSGSEGGHINGSCPITESAKHYQERQYNLSIDLKKLFENVSFSMYADLLLWGADFPTDPMGAVDFIRRIPFMTRQANEGRGKQVLFYLIPIQRVRNWINNENKPIPPPVDPSIPKQEYYKILQTLEHAEIVATRLEDMLQLLSNNRDIVPYEILKKIRDLRYLYKNESTTDQGVNGGLVNEEGQRMVSMSSAIRSRILDTGSEFGNLTSSRLYDIENELDYKFRKTVLKIEMVNYLRKYHEVEWVGRSDEAETAIMRILQREGQYSICKIHFYPSHLDNAVVFARAIMGARKMSNGPFIPVVVDCEFPHETCEQMVGRNLRCEVIHTRPLELFIPKL